MKNNFRIGNVDTIILFGGGKILIDFARESAERSLKTYVFAARRHLEEVIDPIAKVTLENCLKKNHISYFEANDINSCAQLEAINTSSAIGIGLGETYTFSKKTIGLFKGKLFDFMVINLPEYRGGAHFTWQILRSDRQGCWNIQIINEKMIPAVFDSGEIIKKKYYSIPESGRIPQDYFDIACQKGLELFKEFLGDIRANKGFRLCPLKESNSSFFPRLYTGKHGFINWAWDAEEIERFICAFDEPYDGATTFIDGKKAYLKDCRILKTTPGFHPFMSGLVYRKDKNCIFVAANKKTLIIRKVLDERKKNIINSIRLGQRFYTPFKFLDSAMLFKADYGSSGLKK